MASSIGTYELGYTSGSQNGYSKGRIDANSRAFFENLISTGTSVELYPGATFVVGVTELDGIVGSHNVTGQVEFQVGCVLVSCQRTNGTAELTARSGLDVLFTTGYVQNYSGTLSFMLVPSGHTYYIQLQASDNNSINGEVFWNTGLILDIEPPPA